MKKILLTFVAIIGFVLCVNAQKTINAIVVQFPNAPRVSDDLFPNDSYLKGKSFHYDVGAILVLSPLGYFAAISNNATVSTGFDGNGPTGRLTKLSGDKKGGGVGKYYIDSDNVIHLIRDNGFEDTASISYDEDENLVVSFHGKTLRGTSIPMDFTEGPYSQ